MSDHIHLLVPLSGTLSISTALQKIKGSSSKWLATQIKDFAWQEGFGAFGVSASQQDDVIAIQSQSTRGILYKRPSISCWAFTCCAAGA
jgi:REP element-mobilizing transposase RayT